jgi:hypothetical protein
VQKIWGRGMRMVRIYKEDNCLAISDKDEPKE